MILFSGNFEADVERHPPFLSSYVKALQAICGVSQKNEQE